MLDRERRKIVIYDENIRFNGVQVKQIEAIVESALSKHLDSRKADVADMPKGENDMSKKIRRPILIRGATHWVCGNNEQEYAENAVELFQRLNRISISPPASHACSTNFITHAEKFMNLYKRGKVRHTTLAGYEGYLKNHIYPFFW